MTVDAEVSSRIGLMRIVLIAGIVFVHIPFDPDTSPYLGLYGALDWLRVFLGESLFRVGVPCLSAISGYLLFRGGGAAFNYRKTLRRKMQTIVLPFLLWNGALLLAVLVMQRYGIGIGYLPDLWPLSPAGLLDAALAAGGTPINLPLYFLRDLFVCILLSPVLAAAVRRYPAAVLIVLFTLAALPVPLGIVLRNSILFSFTTGIWLALNKADLKSLDPYALPVAGGFLLLSGILATFLLRTGPDFPDWLEISRNVMIIFGIPGFWAIAALLMRSPLGARLSRTGGLSFWIFCGHYPVLLLVWMIWNRSGPAPYPVFYAGAAALTFAALIVSNLLAKQAVPGLYRVLTGSRLAPAHEPSPQTFQQTTAALGTADLASDTNRRGDL